MTGSKNENLPRDPVKCAAIGGGNGLSMLLSGLKTFVGQEVSELSAIVAVTDDGGSSGRLRNELQMPPPGDVRNCMVALSEDSHLLSQLFRFRFAGAGELGGHSFGNLFLAALSEITGDFAEAVRLSSEVLASKGHIYPVTNADVRLAARLSRGPTVKGETNIGKVGAEIDELYLEPRDCHPLPKAIEALAGADIITVGPGSLFTSLLPPLLVEGVVEAIEAANATTILICNLMTQPGETEGFSLATHLSTFEKHVPNLKFDYIIVNEQPITEHQREVYEADGSTQIGLPALASRDVIGDERIVYDRLLLEEEKVRHDPVKLARAVLRLGTQDN